MKLIEINNQDYEFLKNLKKERPNTIEYCEPIIYKVQERREVAVPEGFGESNLYVVFSECGDPENMSYSFLENSNNLELKKFLEENFRNEIKNFSSYMLEEGFKNWNIKCAMSELFNIEEFLRHSNIEYELVFTKYIFVDVAIFLTEKDANEYFQHHYHNLGIASRVHIEGIGHQHKGDLKKLITLIENLEFKEEANV